MNASTGSALHLGDRLGSGFVVAEQLGADGAIFVARNAVGREVVLVARDPSRHPDASSIAESVRGALAEGPSSRVDPRAGASAVDVYARVIVAVSAAICLVSTAATIAFALS